MLHQNNESNTVFIKEYLETSHNLSDVDTKLLQTIKDEQFPGSIIPLDGNYYIGASSQKDWSILNSLIKSFIGTSLSDFSGIKTMIDNSSSLGQLLSKQDIPLSSLISIPSNPESKYNAERALKKLYEVYGYSPNKNLQVSTYINSILENFISALQISDIDTAKQIISQIKKDNRLDALNIKFMQIELAYSIKNWGEIVNDDLITHIINSRKPLKIRLHIIEAFYYEYLSDISNDEEVLSVYQRYIRPNISNLLFKCPANACDVVKFIFLLGYLNNDITAKDISNIQASIETLDNLSVDLKKTINDKISSENIISVEVDVDNYISTRASVIEANNAGTIESKNIVYSKLENLDKSEQLELTKENVIQDIDIENKFSPESWVEWLTFISDESFTNSRQLAEQALEEWPIDEFIRDITDVKTISNTIESIEEDFAIQRFIHSLPLFLESCRRSEHFPNPMLLKMYTSILEVITIHEIKDVNTLIVSQGIVETLLKISPSEEQYKYILGMVDNVIDKTNGKNFINWLLDYAELIISENASDLSSRDVLLEKILNKIYNDKEWLEEYHIKLILKLATQIGIQERFTDIVHMENKIQESPWVKYENKTIGIYTLSENAARHAKEYLEEQIHNVKIILNHDKAATNALRNMAHVSDYLVLVTQAAKHAATGEIQKILRQKGEDPLFPIGKGSSSIISSLLKD